MSYLDRLIEIEQWQGKVVKHFKGNCYLVLDTNVFNTETEERMVYYKAIYGDCKTYIRPMSMFIEECTQEQFEKYGQKYRFECVEMEF